MADPTREIPQRELRNNVAAVHEVEGGVTLRVTVRGRPVADLVPDFERMPGVDVVRV